MDTQNCLRSDMDVITLLSPFISDIFKRLADIALLEKPNISLQGQMPRAFMIHTYGDLDITITMLADKDVYQGIAVHMAKRAQVDEDDIRDYVGEFFNILCGRMISAVNREYRLSIRFGLPEMEKQKSFAGQLIDENKTHLFSFDSIYGAVIIRFEFKEKRSSGGIN